MEFNIQQMCYEIDNGKIVNNDGIFYLYVYVW